MKAVADPLWRSPIEWLCETALCVVCVGGQIAVTAWRMWRDSRVS